MKKKLTHKFFQHKYYKLIIVVILITIIVDAAIILGWHYSERDNKIAPPNWVADKNSTAGHKPFIIYDGYFYYTGTERSTTNLYRITLQDLNNNNLKEELVFRGRDSRGIIALLELRGDLYFKYQSNSLLLDHYDVYKINGDLCEMVLSQNGKFDIWGDDIVLVDFADTNGNNIYKYKQGIFAENISYDGFTYVDLQVFGDFVYTLAEDSNSGDIYNKACAIYRINLITKEQEKLSEQKAEKFAIDPVNGKVYFSSDMGLSVMELDGSDLRELITVPVKDFMLHRSYNSWDLWEYNAIYYSGENGRGLYKLDLLNETQSVILADKYPIASDGSWLNINGYICIKLEQERIGLIIQNESGKQVFSAKHAIKSFTFDGRNAVYEGTNGKLYKADLQQF